MTIKRTVNMPGTVEGDGGAPADPSRRASLPFVFRPSADGRRYYVLLPKRADRSLGHEAES